MSVYKQRGSVYKQRGFTLVELLVVIAIIGILVGLLLPAVQAAREAARRSQCSSQMKQMALAMHNYHDVHHAFPSAQYFCRDDMPCGGRPTWKPGWGWSASILPFVEQGPLFNKFNFSLNMDDPVNVDLIRSQLPIFQCPSDASRGDLHPASGMSGAPLLATANYAGNGGSFKNSFVSPLQGGGGNKNWVNGVLGRDSGISFRDIPDGTSNTIAVGEVTHYQFVWDPTLYGHWYPNSDTACCTLALARHGNQRLNPPPTARTVVRREGFHSFHTGGAQFALCDGSVHFISETIEFSGLGFNSGNPFDRNNNGASYGLYQRLFSRNDSLVVSL